MIEPQPAQDGFERKSFWTKVKDTILGSEDPEEEETDAAPGTATSAKCSRGIVFAPDLVMLRVPYGRGAFLSRPGDGLALILFVSAIAIPGANRPTSE